MSAWPFVVLVAISVVAWLGHRAIQLIPVAPSALKRLEDLRASTQKALDIAGTAVAQLELRLDKAEEDHRRFVTRMGGGKGELIIEKPTRQGPNFPGPG